MQQGSGDEPRLGRAHKSRVFDPRGRTEAALRSAGPAGGEQPRRSPGRPPARPCRLRRFPERGCLLPGSIWPQGAERGCSTPAGWREGAKVGFSLHRAVWAIPSLHAGDGELSTPSLSRTQLPASQAARGLPSESGFVWRLPAGKAAGSPRSAGYPAAAHWEKPAELGQQEGERGPSQGNAYRQAPLLCFCKSAH